MERTLRRQTTRGAALLAGLLLWGACASTPGTPEQARMGTPGSPSSLDDGWTVGTPEELGLARAPLAEMTEALHRDEYPNVHAVLIAKGGKLVYEEYFAGTDLRWGSDGARHTVELQFDRDTLHDTRSVGKSITSALVGIALASTEGTSVDRPLLDFLPAHAHLAIPERRGITLEHALTMSAGLDCNEGDVPYTNSANHAEQMSERADPVAFVLDRSLVSEPGSTWSYNSGLPTLSGLAVAGVTDRPFGDFARAALFEPLGITDLEWGGPPAWSGIPALRWAGSEPWSRVANPAGSMWFRPRDLLKLGSLYLDDGRWNGKRILPERWVEESLTPRIERPEALRQHGEGVVSHGAYGYHWWHDRYTLPYGELVVHAARGNGGQRIWVVPELDLVAVHLTGNYNLWWSSYQAERLLLERIVPWAMDIGATYRHEVGRSLRVLEPGQWPQVEFDPSRYVGVWEERGDRVEIKSEGGNLLMMLPGTSGVHLIPESEHVFAFGRIVDGVPTKLYWRDHRLIFIPNEAGRIVRYEERAAGREEAVLVGRRLEVQQGD